MVPRNRKIESRKIIQLLQ